MPVADFTGRAARFFEPFREILQLDLMLDAHVANRNGDDIEAVGNAGQVHAYVLWSAVPRQNSGRPQNQELTTILPTVDLV
jgi:hypothetical protein